MSRGRRTARDTPEGNPWYRAIYADEQPVGFVMLSWNVTPDPPRIIGPWFVWKLLIDERQQGRAARPVLDRLEAELPPEQLVAARDAAAAATLEELERTTRQPS